MPVIELRQNQGPLLPRNVPRIIKNVQPDLCPGAGLYRVDIPIIDLF